MTTNFDHIIHTLHKIALQAYTIALSLQNAAPAQFSTADSVKYLLEISLFMEKIKKQMEEYLLSGISFKK